jgi:hypothetical protein
MHLIQQYALASSSKISEPSIVEKYFPMTVEKYITIHTTSKPSKTYDYFQEVVNLIKPLLSKNGIEIVQVGANNEVLLEGCYNTVGQTSINQVAYIVKKALLHVGVDSFPAHFAGAFNIPIVALYSNNFINNVRPYWGDRNKQSLLEPDRTIHGKPNFTLDERPKTINTINPETIASEVCRLLNIDFKYNLKTIYIGEVYKDKGIEIVPDNTFNPQQIGLNASVVRMDILFKEDVLEQQLSICPCCIVTNKPINENILKKFRPGILEIIYFVGPNNPPSIDFLKQMKDLKISFKILSDSSEEELNPFKLDVIDYGIIFRRNWKKPNTIKEKLSDFYYKSNKFIVGRNKIYQSEYDYHNDRPIPSLYPVPQKIIDNPNIDKLWRESEHCLFSKLDN